MMYAVITGDLVNSSQVEASEKNMLINSLKEAFTEINSWKLKKKSQPVTAFDIFRGDSFQGVLADINAALKAAIIIRAIMRKNQPADKEENWDARLAIGLGAIDHLPENISEGDGPAYRNSGPALDNLKGDYKLAITTPREPMNHEFKATCALLDALIAKWTAPQAEIIGLLLQDKNAKTIAEELGISQAAVHYRVKGAGWFAIQAALKRFNQIAEMLTRSDKS